MTNLCVWRKSTCRAASHALWQISKIRKYMDMNCTKQLHGLVISKLDYANAILYGLPDNVVKQLQHVQNAAAKVIFQKRKYDHVTPILKELHWLPVQFRIKFKFLTFVYRCVNGSAPKYLQDLILWKPVSINIHHNIVVNIVVDIVGNIVVNIVVLHNIHHNIVVDIVVNIAHNIVVNIVGNIVVDIAVNIVVEHNIAHNIVVNIVVNIRVDIVVNIVVNIGVDIVVNIVDNIVVNIGVDIVVNIVVVL